MEASRDQLGTDVAEGPERDGACYIGRLKPGREDRGFLPDFFLPFAAGGNPAVPGPCESNKGSDQATALQPAAPS